MNKSMKSMKKKGRTRELEQEQRHRVSKHHLIWALLSKSFASIFSHCAKNTHTHFAYSLLDIPFVHIFPQNPKWFHHGSQHGACDEDAFKVNEELEKIASPFAWRKIQKVNICFEAVSFARCYYLFSCSAAAAALWICMRVYDLISTIYTYRQ